MKPMLTIRETAELLSIGESSVRRMVKSGALPSCRFGPRTIRVPSAELGTFIQCSTDWKGQSSMASGLNDGTLFGQTEPGRVVNLHGRMTLVSPKPSLQNTSQPQAPHPTPST